VAASGENSQVTKLRKRIRRVLEHPRGPRITVIRAGGLGDTLLVLPVAEAFLREAPEASVTLLGSAWAERLHPLLKSPLHVARMDSAEVTPLFAEDVEKDPTGLLAEASVVVAYCSRPPDTLTRNARRLCPGRVIEWPVHPDGTVHATVHFLRAVASAPAPVHVPPPALAVPRNARRWAERTIAEVFGRGVRPVAVHPGSGGRRKCWPVERFAGLIELIEHPVLLLEGPADAEAAGALACLLPAGLPVAQFGVLPLGRAAALLSCSGLYVGNDSGLTHMAAALGGPTVAVFGPTDPAVWAPRGRRVVVCRAADAEGGAWPEPDEVLRAVQRLRRPQP
jgi:ADP-heptose:LPS heptosyltransferase